tara:strand:- start:1964 stop:3208 length:1245 start_codon:yes stop_codon:yes gene_type:complete
MNNNIIQYDVELVNTLLNKYTELPNKYIKQYEDAYNIIKKSDNYQYINNLLKSMIKITKKENYSKIDENKMLLVSLLNKLTNKNYNLIKNKIINDIEYSHELLYYLCDNIFLKILNDTKYNTLYIKLVIEISKNNNFYINKKDNFFTIMINKCNELYNLNISQKTNYINSILKYENEDISLFFKIKKNLKNLLLIISTLIYEKMIDNIIIDYILNDLLINCKFRVELLCEFININNIFSIKQKNRINNYLNSIKDKYDSRIKFLIEEIKIEKSNLIINKKNIQEKEISIKIDKKMKLNNLLNEYLIHNNDTESISYLKEFINDYINIVKDFLYIIFDFEESKFNKILILFKKFLNLRIPFQINILNEINEEFNELILDYPLCKIYYNSILKELVTYNYLEEHTYNLIYNKFING